MKYPFPALLLRCVSLAALLASPAVAANTWTNAAGSSTWDPGVSNNWTTPPAWVNGDDAIFNTTGAGTLNLVAGVSANSLTFNAPGYTLTGAPLTLTGPAITTAASTDITMQSPLAGTAGMTKSGTGWLRLTGANTFTGPTTSIAGALFASNPTGTSLPGNLTLGNGTSAAFLITTAPNQFAPGAVLTFANTTLDAKFQLRGNNQTVGGLSSAATNSLSIIQNDEAGTPGYTDVAPNATLTINNSTDQSFYGIIRNQSGVLSLVKEGTGTQELRNTITAVGLSYSGTTTINNGRLTLNLAGGTNGFSSAVTVNAGGTLGLNGTFTMSPVISGAGQVVKIGTGAVTIGGTAANTFTGLTYVTGSGTLILAKTGGVNAVGGNVTIGDTLSNSVLRLGASDQIPDTSVLTFSSGTAGGTGGKLELQNFTETVAGISSTGGVSLIQTYETGGTGTGTLIVNNAADHLFDGIIRNGGGGTLALTKTGAGTLTILNTTTATGNSYTGLTTVSGGLLQFGNSTASRRAVGAGAIQIDAAGRVLIWNNNAQTHGNTFTGSGRLDFRSNSSATSGGGNEHIITGNNSGFSGAITVTDSRLRIQDAGSRLGDASATNTITTIGNAQLMYNGSGTYNYNVRIQGLGYYETLVADRFGALRLEGGANQAGTVTLLADSGIGSHQSGGTISGIISDGGNGYSINKLGINTLTLTNANTYSGQTIVQAGTLALSGVGSIVTSSGINVATGATFDVSATTLPWNLGATQTLQGNGTVKGNLSVAGVIAPGNSAGVLTLQGNTVLTAGSLWQIELGGAGPTEYDRLLGIGTNSLTAGGTLAFSYLNGFQPSPGDSFFIAGNFQSISAAGAVFDFTAAPAGPGNSWDTSTFTTDGKVTFVPEVSSLFLTSLASLALLRRRRQAVSR